MKPETRGLQAALAFLLVDKHARAQLRSGDVGPLSCFELSEDEQQVLRELDVKRLLVTTEMVRNKRLFFLRKAMPATIELLLGPAHRYLLSEFLVRTYAFVETHSVSRGLHEGRRLVQYLTSGVSSVAEWVSDLATFELLQVELLASADRAGSAGPAARGVQAGRPILDGLKDDDQLLVGEHVRWLSYRYDPVDIASAVKKGEIPDPPVSPGAITLVALPKRRSVKIFRTGEGALMVLKMCASPVRVSKVKVVVNGFGDERAAHWLNEALHSGMISVRQ